MQRRSLGWLNILLLVVPVVAVTVCVYQPVWHGGFIWDDDRYVTNNPLLTASDGLRRIWFSLDAPSQYFPLSYTLLRFEHAWWGLNPAGYHWVNILLHVANALLVWRVLVRLQVPGSWLAAAIFALHPVQVESVAWISEVKNLLMGFFFLLTLLAWIEYVDSQTQRRRIIYLAALLFYFLALAAKSTACTLPAALVLILWLRKKPIDRRAIFEIIPFLVLALGAGLIAVWWEKYHQGTRVLVSLAPMERLLIASRAVWFYLSKIFWPSNLTFIYPQWKIDPSDASAYFWLVATSALILVVYFSKRFFGRGIEVGFLFFVATLSPLLGFIMLYTFRYTFVADHYQYLACLGPIALASAGFTKSLERMGNAQWIRWTTALAAIACLSVLTFRQSATYHDLETLWRATIAKDPSSWMAYNNLGVVEVEKGNLDDAIANYQRSLQLHPEYPEALYNLGSALLQKGEADKAVELCEQALKLQPNDVDAHVVLGNALMAKQDIDRAISHYHEALKLQPDDSNAHHNLGVALQQQGKNDEAAREFEKAGEGRSNRKQ
ncbi:MAG TPA: tetratricopeptide repeat protein [Chthoniobacterales bacterium]|nr:tetratricopeptide repeat protein [Chthoniobacterales bacterium]